VNVRRPEPLRPLAITYAALLALLALSAGSALLPLGVFNAAINMGVSVAKALLVMSVFMRLTTSPAVVRLFAAAGFAWLCVLVSIAAGDYLTR